MKLVRQEHLLYFEGFDGFGGLTCDFAEESTIFIFARAELSPSFGGNNPMPMVTSFSQLDMTKTNRRRSVLQKTNRQAIFDDVHEPHRYSETDRKSQSIVVRLHRDSTAAAHGD
jgi:hypothetical protein